MAQNTVISAKVKEPRNLENKETRENLEHWFDQFRQYWKRDDRARHFMLPTSVWDTTKVHWGQAQEAEDSKLKRSAAEMKIDLEDLLDTVSGYLPFRYITQTLKSRTTCWKKVKEAVFEIYGVQTTATTQLNFAKIKKQPDETYRQMFERMVAHVEQHLPHPEKEFTLGGIKVETAGEKMTVGLYNHLVIDWLRAIDPKLIGIVQVAYSKELKQRDCQLYSLVPDIADNIEELLGREELLVQRLTTQLQDQFEIRRFRDDRRGDRSRGRGRGRGQSRDGEPYNLCSKCVTLQAAMKTARFSARHDPRDCPNKQVYVRAIEDDNVGAAGGEGSDRGDVGDCDQYTDFDEDDGENIRDTDTHLTLSVQVTDDLAQPRDTCDQQQRQGSFINVSQNLDISDSDKSDLQTSLNRVTDLPTKAESPALEATYKGETVVVVIDTGAELNCLDKNIAEKLGVKYKNSEIRANAAGDAKITVCGLTDSDFIIQTKFQEETVDINLQKTVIVNKLGTDILLGEPGIGHNGIKTDARKTRIELHRDGRYLSKAYLSGYRAGYELCRMMKSTRAIYPGETVDWDISPKLPRDEVYALAPRREHLKGLWYRPGIYKAKDGRVRLTNVSQEVINFVNKDQIGELRICHMVKPEKPGESSQICKLETLPLCDFKYELFGKPHETKSEPDIDLDPDNIMPATAKQAIREISNKFASVFTKAPGKYNGFYGRVNNSLNFASRPTPNKRVYQPQYSEEMKRKQAELMDKLYDYGVLRTPEEVGVSVETISPSLIVAKSEPGEFRLVTDLSNINVHIKKAPAVSPTIAEARAMLAKKKLMIHVDLSNYFFQSGMAREDCQWLGTVHPYRGTMCYVVEPQGLRNASEHGYEILARVYGDLCQTGAMTRMADSLFVLGDDYTELIKNYEELLTRAHKAGLTFKPGKTVVCPRSTVLFGWLLEGTEWRPTSHTVSALSRALQPGTVKGLRSFLGSYKQFTECVADYSHLLHDLDMVCAGRGSAEQIIWTPELIKKFEAAKAATAGLKGVNIPRPDDTLITFSDYSEEHKAIGGRLLIKRKVDGKIVDLHGGYFSQTLDRLKQKWLPCEGEALGIRLTLEHFAPFLRENKNISVHYTDNSPCVQAYKRSLIGAFSSSARISQFLTGLSALPVELRHRPGKDMHSSDFISRNPVTCSSPEKCQLCRFARGLQKEGNEAAKIKSVLVKDILEGETIMPYTQRRTWLGTQLQDSVHTNLKKLISTSQLPEKRKTRGDATKLKQLHTLYAKNELKIDSKDGLVMIKHPEGHFGGWVISIPYQLFPGLANALHITLQHPSRGQLATLMARYFYCPGHTAIIHEVTDGCSVCRSLQRLPKSLLVDTTEKVSALGTEFAVDVMERNSQRIFLAREKLSQFTWLLLIENQTKETLRTAILQTILPWAHQSGATVRCDGATGFTSLASESNQADSILAKNKIRIDVGRTFNRNKNPVAENGIQECEREILRHKAHTATLSQDDLCIVQRTMNSRIRSRGLAAKEILIRRDLVSQEPKDINDNKLSEEQQARRQQATVKDTSIDPLKKKHEFHVGDLVFQKDQLSKHQARQTFIITAFVDDMVEIQKLHTQFRQKKYRVYPDEIVPAVNNNNQLFDRRHKQPDSDNNTKSESTPPEVEVSRPQLNLRPRPSAQSRPQRQAASRAREAWNSVLSVQTYGTSASLRTDRTLSQVSQTILTLPSSPEIQKFHEHLTPADEYTVPTWMRPRPGGRDRRGEDDEEDCDYIIRTDLPVLEHGDGNEENNWYDLVRAEQGSLASDSADEGEADTPVSDSADEEEADRTLGELDKTLTPGQPRQVSDHSRLRVPTPASHDEVRLDRTQNLTKVLSQVGGDLPPDLRRHAARVRGGPPSSVSDDPPPDLRSNAARVRGGQARSVPKRASAQSVRDWDLYHRTGRKQNEHDDEEDDGYRKHY